MKKRILSLLLALCLLLPLFAFAEEQNVYLNDLAGGDAQIEVRFLRAKEDKKSDATVLLITDSDSTEILLVDGGLANTRCYQELNAIRTELLEANGLSDQARNSHYKLRVNLFVTHCHKDHIAELYTNIVIFPYFEIESLYLPEANAMPTDDTYANDANADLGHRTKLLEAMARYAPDAPITVVPFGETLEFDLNGAHAKIFASLIDYGSPEGLAYIKDTYYAGKSLGQIHDKVPTAVLNANCEWLRLTLGESSILFPGDVMKKRNYLTDEPFDQMVARYGEEMRSDIVKYPHHGIERNPAAKPLVENLLEEGGVVVLTTDGARENAGAQLEGLATWVTTEDGDQTFILTPDGLQK